jgi:hypothetical protein
MKVYKEIFVLGPLANLESYFDYSDVATIRVSQKS